MGCLGQGQLNATVRLLDRAEWWHWTGANRQWMLEAQLKHGLLLRDEGLVNQSFFQGFQAVRIMPEHGDGIMQDGSFHQHGPQLLVSDAPPCCLCPLLGSHA